MITGSLTNKVAIVTGGGRGIGKAIAEGFACAGAKVLVVARTAAEVEAVCTSIQASGGEAMAMVVDVTHEADVKRMAETAKQQWGRIDVLVNNAGIGGPQGHILDLDLKKAEETWQVNVLGPFLCCRAVIPHMIVQGGGNIINVSSGAGQRKPRQHVRSLPYQLSKFALEGLTNGLAVQLRSHNINVNSLSPGPVATRLHENTPAHMLAALADKMSQPEDVVPAAIFLASQEPGQFTDQLVEAKSFKANL